MCELVFIIDSWLMIVRGLPYLNHFEPLKLGRKNFQRWAKSHRSLLESLTISLNFVAETPHMDFFFVCVCVCVGPMKNLDKTRSIHSVPPKEHRAIRQSQRLSGRVPEFAVNFLCDFALLLLLESYFWQLPRSMSHESNECRPGQQRQQHEH